MIAIIMAVYNGERYLREQLDSLLQNTCQDWRLYLFDDGSTDRTLELAEEYARAYPKRIRIRKNPENLRSARNFFNGIRQVQKEEPADYYMFCDQDDIWDLDKIELSLQKLQELEKQVCRQSDIPLLVYTDSRLSDETGAVTASSFQKSSHYCRITKPASYVFAHLLMENTMPGCTQIMNRALVERALRIGQEGSGDRIFPPGLKMHDWWFGLVAAGFGKIGYLDRATMTYRQHEGNVVGGTGFASYLKSRLLKIHTLRRTIKEDIRQGESFYEWYGSELSREEQKVLKSFCALRRAGYLKRRMLLIRYHFWKSGLIRNVVLFFLV